MSEDPPCPKCGAKRPASGECARCLLDVALDAGAERGDDWLTPEQLAEHFPDLDIEEMIGRGGMGAVYRARQRELGRTVALKVLLPALEDDSGFAERFSREARALAHLSHPNIVTVFEFGETDGLYYLLMEHVDGTTLRQAMSAGALDPTQALAIVPQICDALQYAHDQGVVHRDIKPENVLLDRTGAVRIADFGLAKLATDLGQGHTLTRAGQVMGTVNYMAPEQMRTPADVDHRADIYSLGVVFYEMLTGELPIGRFDPPSKSVQVDVRLDEVVLRTLEYERDRRYQRVADVKGGIDTIASSPGGAADEHEHEHEHTHPPARFSRKAIAGALCIPATVAGQNAVMFIPMMAQSMSASMAALPAMGLAAAVIGLIGLAGVVLSVAAWIDIAHSDGRLRGKWLAVTGTFLPLLLSVPAGYTSLQNLGEYDFRLLLGVPELEVIEVDPNAAYPADEVVEPPVREDVEALVDRLIASKGPLGDLDAMAEFYSPIGLGQLRDESDTRLANGSRKALIGLPMIDPDLLHAPLAEYTERKIVFPYFGAPGYRNRTANVELTLPGRWRVLTRVVRHEGTWYFAAERIMIAPVYAFTDPSPDER